MIAQAIHAHLLFLGALLVEDPADTVLGTRVVLLEPDSARSPGRVLIGGKRRQRFGDDRRGFGWADEYFLIDSVSGNVAKHLKRPPDSVLDAKRSYEWPVFRGPAGAIGDITGDYVAEWVAGAGSAFSFPSVAEKLVVVSGSDGEFVRIDDPHEHKGCQAGLTSLTRMSLSPESEGSYAALAGCGQVYTVDADGAVRQVADLTETLSDTFTPPDPHKASCSCWSALAATGDVDADGREDFAVGCKNPTLAGESRPGSGVVAVLSGRDWTRLGVVLVKVGEGFSHGELPSEIAAMGDVNEDGHADFAVGTAEVHGISDDERRYVALIDGKTLTELWSFAAPSQGFGAQFGTGFATALASLPDINGDGARDLAVGQPDEIVKRGRVVLFSGRDGTMLGEIKGRPRDCLGTSLAATNRGLIAGGGLFTDELRPAAPGVVGLVSTSGEWVWRLTAEEAFGAAEGGTAPEDE